MRKRTPIIKGLVRLNLEVTGEIVPPIIIDTYKQHDDLWFAAILGNPGASNFGKIVTSTGKISAQRQEYLYKLAGEMVSGRREESFTSYRMQQGTENESESRRVYEMENEIEIRQVALVYKDEERIAHSSPDGLIGENGGFETKDAKFSVQIKRLFAGKMVTEHIPQCQGGLYICEREYWIFRSYCSGLPSLDIRVERDENYISILNEELPKFCYELATTIRRLKEMRGNYDGQY